MQTGVHTHASGRFCPVHLAETVRNRPLAEGSGPGAPVRHERGATDGVGGPSWVGLLVEVAGIEPASAGGEPVLLRAQPAVAFLSPGDPTGRSPSRAQSLFVSHQLRDRAFSQWPSSDARSRGEGILGLTASHSLRQRGRTRTATCWQLLICDEVYEITSPSRPASPGSSNDVEACHPLVLRSAGDPSLQAQRRPRHLCSPGRRVTRPERGSPPGRWPRSAGSRWPCSGCGRTGPPPRSASSVCGCPRCC